MVPAVSELVQASLSQAPVVSWLHELLFAWFRGTTKRPGCHGGCNTKAALTPATEIPL
jgi:hypothetical protein